MFLPLILVFESLTQTRPNWKRKRIRVRNTQQLRSLPACCSNWTETGNRWSSNSNRNILCQFDSRSHKLDAPRCPLLWPPLSTVPCTDVFYTNKR